ncbi:prepilin peptidase [Curtobacterium sp. 1P10AnD]|uniref:prepilin peptidase n=1 Tax=Curtobacterium sp. 1P10AnD TaxID=3132283 RepID=UPI00399F16AE
MSAPLPIGLVASFAAMFGLLIGSFLNVVVYRVPAGLSVVRPASACPACQHPIRRRDNVPVLSWIVLRARCRDCGVRIPARYPAVEAATGVLFALVVWSVLRARVVTDGDAAVNLTVTVALLYLMAISVALTLIDLDVHRLPNAITYPSAVVLVVLLVIASALGGDWGALSRGVLGAAGLGLFYLLLAVAVPGGMGLGDVKLAVILGLVLAYLGWGPLAVGAFGAFVVGGIFAVVLLITGRVRWRGGVPFGPAMLAGAWIGVFFGTPVWTAYTAVLGTA